MRHLTLEDLSDAITLTEGLFEQKRWYVSQPSNLWKYFCGVCWGMIKQRREASDADQGSV